MFPRIDFIFRTFFSSFLHSVKNTWQSSHECLKQICKDCHNKINVVASHKNIELLLCLRFFLLCYHHRRQSSRASESDKRELWKGKLKLLNCAARSSEFKEFYFSWFIFSIRKIASPWLLCVCINSYRLTQKKNSNAKKLILFSSLSNFLFIISKQLFVHDSFSH